MKKTSVYLDEADATRLDRAARRRGISRSEALRTAIRLLAMETQPDRNFAMDGWFMGDGTSIADVEEELMKGFGQ